MAVVDVSGSFYASLARVFRRRPDAFEESLVNAVPGSTGPGDRQLLPAWQPSQPVLSLLGEAAAANLHLPDEFQFFGTAGEARTAGTGGSVLLEAPGWIRADARVDPTIAVEQVEMPGH